MTDAQYAMQAPTTCLNARRILRGLQLPRPLLLEGAPGVGKTSLVAAVARLAGRELARINLSEQTDVTDLFGADLPVEGASGGAFAWRDRPFLQALKAGHWVVFDELNLASQSVLEGLNACLDHRGEVFVPELGRTFHIQHGRTRIFACQNPLNQGGGRKGLPRSFLNRFTQVYVEPLSRGDLIFICSTMYPSIPLGVLTSMVDFNMKMHEATMVDCSWGRRGAPWEFNLRDINRWCDLLLANQATEHLDPAQYISLVYQARMRTSEDKHQVLELYKQVFRTASACYQPSRLVHVAPSHVQAGNAFLERRSQRHRGAVGGDGDGGALLLHHSLEALEWLMTCVNMGWMSILVGPASSGKSSLVRLLAELTGRSLCVLPMSSAMDTTELLGGFEQADIGRHIVELTKEVVAEVRAFQRVCLVDGDAAAQSVAAALDGHLVKLMDPLTETVVESKEETAALMSQVKQLKRLVHKLSKLQPNSEHLQNLSSALEQQQQALQRATPGGGGVGGGTFEWVDSLLVKALRSGDWLLVDNVNFCSPSVLDRLNALLEPGGVLTINERGVMDGSVPTVTPHPDFRLFLSMDPKYGEISRAMRNRGVEIYLLGEEDGCPYSQHDTLSMLHGAGLSSQLACDWLMELHTLLRLRLPANEQPGVCDLLRAGMMVKQQMEKGGDMESALRHAAENVYVRSVRSVVARQCVKAVASDQFEQLKTKMTSGKSSEQQVDWSLVAPSVEQYRNHSGLTCSQQAARVLDALLSQPDKLGYFAQDTLSSADNYLRSIQSAFSIFVSLQSEQNWNLSMDWLKLHIPQRQGATWARNSQYSADDWHTLQQRVDSLMGAAETSLEVVFHGQVWREYRRAVEKVCGQCQQAGQLFKEQSWDLATNPQALLRVTTLLTQSEHGQHIQEEMNSIMHTVHRFQLMQAAVWITEEMKSGLTQLAELSRKVGGHKSKSSTVLNHLCHMLSCLQSRLATMVALAPDHSITVLHQKQDQMLWLPRLLLDCLTSRRGQVEEVFLSQLSLHWHWCQRKVLSHLVTPVSEPVLLSAISQLNALLGENNIAAKLFVKFWLAWGHPRAFRTETEAKLWLELQALCDVLSVNGPLPAEALKPKVTVMTSHGKLILGGLLRVAQKLSSGDLEVDSDLQSIKETLAAHGLRSRMDLAASTPISSTTTVTSSVPNTSSESQNSSFVQLWPMFEHLGLLAELSVSLSSSRGGGRDWERRMALTDFTVTFTPTLDFGAVCVKKNLGHGERMRGLLLVLQRMWTSLAVTGTTRWLMWGSGKDADDTRMPSQDTDGPAVFHRSSLLFHASHLLSASRSQGHHNITSGHSDLLPLNVTLGGVDQELSQLDTLCRYLWRHAGVMGAPGFTLRMLAENLLVQTFLALLTSLTPLMEPSVHAAWTTVINDLHNITEEGDDHLAVKVAQFAHWRRSQSLVLGWLNEIQSLLVAHCTVTKLEQVDSIIGHCLQVMGEAVCSSSGGGSCAVGQALVYVGLALSHLLAPRGPVDPVQKAAIKLGHFRKELLDTEIELQVWEAHLQLTTGRGITQTDSRLYHPRLVFLLQRRSHLQTKVASLEERQAYRRNGIKYLRLCQEVQNFLQTVASPSVVGSLVTRLKAGGTSDRSSFEKKAGVTMTSLQEEQTWQATTQRLSQRLGREYPYLLDVTTPVCLAVEVMRLGMRCLAQEVQLRVNQMQILCWPPSGKLEDVVTDLCAFPSIRPATPTLLHLAVKLSSGTSGELIGYLDGGATSGVEMVSSSASQSRLLLCSLLLLKAHAQYTQELTPDLFATLTHVLDLFVSAWREQEERRRQKEEEEAALFRFKSRIHGDERTEAEQEDDHFRQMFPMYREDFSDMVEASRLEDTGMREQPMEEDDDAITTPDTISEEEMDQVCSCHLDLLTHLTSAHWLRRRPVSSPTSNWDILRPALLSYKLAVDIGKQSWELLSENVDQRTLGSHLLVSGSVGQSVHAGLGDADSDAMACSLRPSNPKCYNIYTDPNVPEVIQCRPIFRQVVSRVNELQQEWPEHPTLKQLCDLVERIESFPVSSPVIKFLTGLELLLQTAQHWESNASSRVSMATQLAEVTAIIVRWRKLELGCWSGSLDIEVERSRRRASRWWFHLYNLTSSFLSQQDKMAVEELLTSLKQFMEGSSLGEFSARLNILLAFHCQLVNTQSSQHKDLLLCLLWNVHQFYKQFQPLVDAEIARLHTPIEKELKGFVKIARWSDMNYWALKESTEKTHRTVHKRARAFQAVLNQPVKNLLGEKPVDRVALETEDEVCSYGEQVIMYHKVAVSRSGLTSDQTDSAQVQPILKHFPACPLQQKLSSLCTRAQRHWRGVVSSDEMCQDIATLDDLTGQLIEEAHELQKLEVTQNADKEKQRADAKHINLRKRKALADLFKQLTALGLSYRKGLNKEKSNHVDSALQFQPLDPSAALEKSSPLVGLWGGCDKYFMRCLSRLSQLLPALQSASKELGPANIERCHGFTEHMMTVYLAQRRNLTEVFSCFVTLREQLASLKSLQTWSVGLPPQAQARQWLARVKEHTTRVIQGLTQFSLLLQACPPSPSESRPTCHPSPFPPGDLSPMSHMLRGDELWTGCQNSVKTFLEMAKKIHLQLLPISDKVMLTSHDVETITNMMDELSSIGCGLKEMTRSLGFPDDDSDNNGCLTSTVTFLSDSIADTHNDFSTWRNGLPSVSRLSHIHSTDTKESGCAALLTQLETAASTPEGAEVFKFAEQVESLVQSTLLSVQRLVKNEEQKVKTEGREKEGEIKRGTKDGEKEEEQEEGLRQNHLMVVVETLQQHIMSLQCHQVVKDLQDTLNNLKEMTDSTSSSSKSSGDQSAWRVTVCAGLLRQCGSLLEVFNRMVETHVAQALAVHRTLGKMLSVLLAIFTELAQKGFCLPAEYSDEVAGEGATDFVDIEGGGIGEGEGAKDVSDQIESEDQLDEARRPEDQREDEKQPQQDLPSEDNAIEMSDDFDAKLQDLEPAEGDDDEDEKEKKEEEEMEKQMGEVDGPDSDRLDDQMWGSDEEEESKEQEKEEEGPGSGEQGESELVAKDDVKDSQKADKQGEKEEDKKQNEKDENEEKTPHQLEEFDQSEYDDNRTDPHHGDQKQQEEPENLDLPDDLKLDEDEKGEDGAEAGEEEPPGVPEDEMAQADLPEDTAAKDPDTEPDTDAGGEDDKKNEEDEKREEKPAEALGQDEDADMKENEEEGKKEDETWDLKENDAQEEERKDEEGEGDKGLEPKNKEASAAEQQEDGEEGKQPQGVEDRGKTTHDTPCAIQSDTAQDETGGQNEEEEREGVGTATPDQQEGHEGTTSSKVTEGNTTQQRQQTQRRPGQSKSERSLGFADEKFKRLKTTDRSSQNPQDSEEREETREADMYEHITDNTSHADAQTLDAATVEQQQQQQVVAKPDDDNDDDGVSDDDVQMDDDEDKENQKVEEKSAKQLMKQKVKETQVTDSEQDGESMEMERGEITGSKVLTLGAERPPESTIHTQLEHLHLDSFGAGVDVDALRSQLEDSMRLWAQPDPFDHRMAAVAAEAWQKYETLTAGLSQELCEQLRLILEPSQATKLRGDYRTGKRLNMRKVIPYIASQFRKDKIWLRRTKPSKRQYQIMLAIDDSSSMADNHSKQLAFESLALTANALTLLETGELAVCSFGEMVKLLHPFTQPFSNQAGARILQQFTFEQKKTRIAQLLQQATSVMVDSRGHQQGSFGRPETAQLVLIVSDGRGMFAEGRDAVRMAVRQAREANIFLVFIILDEPENKDSILDIKVPVFKPGGQLPEIRSYMEDFPFPFYVILRDINSLPQILSDALRQWFELVTAVAS